MESDDPSKTSLPIILHSLVSVIHFLSAVEELYQLWVPFSKKLPFGLSLIALLFTTERK